MSNITTYGPQFQPQSNEAILLLGNSERFSTGQFLANTLVERKIFEDVFIFTVNDADTPAGQRALASGLETRVAVSHSIGGAYILDTLRDTGTRGLQLIATNPVEPLSRFQQAKRVAVDFKKEKFDKEPGAEYTGKKGQKEAIKEMARGFPTTLKTMSKIAGGFSTTQRMIEAARDGLFPAGQAIIHSELDRFGFATMADLGRVAQHGITAVLLHGHEHNEILYASASTIALSTPHVFPETEANPAA